MKVNSVYDMESNSKSSHFINFKENRTNEWTQRKWCVPISSIGTSRLEIKIKNNININ